MPTYDIQVVLASDTDASSATDFRNGDWELTGSMSTITVSDEDALGLGDDDPSTETGAPATITAVDGDTSHPLVGSDVFAKYIRADDEFGAADTSPDVVFLGTGSGFNNFAVAAYPGSGWSMSTGDRYQANSTTTNASTGGSWSREAQLDPAPPCFTTNCLIETDRGHRMIQDLRPGDKIQTRDNGFQSVRWIYRKDMNAQYFIDNPWSRPVVIKANSFGWGRPIRDTALSPMHLVLLDSDHAGECFVYARDLVQWDRVTRITPTQTAYFHLLFDDHQVVRGDNLWSESFNLSETGLKKVDTAARKELLNLFPDLQSNTVSDMELARPKIASAWIGKSADSLSQFKIPF